MIYLCKIVPRGDIGKNNAFLMAVRSPKRSNTQWYYQRKCHEEYIVHIESLIIVCKTFAL